MSQRGFRITSKGRVKVPWGLVAFVDSKRVRPWTRLEVGRAYHITARRRRLFFR